MDSPNSIFEVQKKFHQRKSLSQDDLRIAETALESADMHQSILGCEIFIRSTEKRGKERALKKLQQMVSSTTIEDVNIVTLLLSILLQAPIQFLQRESIRRFVLHFSSSDDHDCRLNAVLVAGRLATANDREAIRCLNDRVNDPNEMVRTNASFALHGLGEG